MFTPLFAVEITAASLPEALVIPPVVIEATFMSPKRSFGMMKCRTTDPDETVRNTTSRFDSGWVWKVRVDPSPRVKVPLLDGFRTKSMRNDCPPIDTMSPTSNSPSASEVPDMPSTTPIRLPAAFE